MMLFTALRARQEIQRLRADVTRRGYETGYYGLTDQSQQWIDSHVRVVAQNLYGHQVAPPILQSEVERLETALAQAAAAENATRAQVDLQPALVSTLRWPRVATLCAATYLMGEALQYTMGRMTAREWLTLCVAIGLATAPWVLGLPIVAGYRARWRAWQAAAQVRRLRRRVMNKREKLEQAVAQASRVEQWITNHIAALQQDHHAALEPAKKAREQMAQLDSFAPPTIEKREPTANGLESPLPHLNGAAQPKNFNEELALV